MSFLFKGSSGASSAVSVAHNGDASLTAADMIGQRHTNNGAGAAPVRLELPAAATNLHAWFMQLDSGNLLIAPLVGDHLEWSGGVMDNGEALQLQSPISALYVFSDGNSRWIVASEMGTVTEETP